MKEMTPMMKQYLSIHDTCRDAILFFRLGDFYEMFFDDAITASRELNLVLTGKDCGLDERAPMCGIPFHAVDSYISKLIEKGYKIAICEQTEDPALAKGLVERSITRIITAGTVVDTTSLREDSNNYIMSVYYNKSEYAVCYADVSTGEFFVSLFNDEKRDTDFIDLLSAITPSEILVNQVYYVTKDLKEKTESLLKISLNILSSSSYEVKKCEELIKEQFHISNLASAGIENSEALKKCAGALIEYLHDTQKVSLEHITTLKLNKKNSFMLLDYSTRKNLELTQNSNTLQKVGSLFWVLDNTHTNIGARTLKNWINEPLTDKDEIEKRLNAVEYIMNDIQLQNDLIDELKKVSDIKRILSKVSYKTITGRELLSLKDTLNEIPVIKSVLSTCSNKLLSELCNKLDELRDIYSLLEASVSEECTNNNKDGNLIKLGFNEEVDRLKSIKTNSRQILMDLEARERQNTGINNLKVKYNKVFGYYIEVSKGNLNMVPDYFIRKQTLVNAERFYTEELKTIEIDILEADDKLIKIEEKIYNYILDTLIENIVRIQTSAEVLGITDVLLSFATLSLKNHYCKAKINEEGRISYKNGRHPVIEKIIGFDSFMPNDLLMDNDSTKMIIITGPNMAGKSTYIRQSALIVLMNQIGCFVPCDSADLCICDRIFTRVGASDDLANGQSTFMVEMSEVSNILKNATKDSFVILDEVGRGTGTTDGLSIAWSVADYLLSDEGVGAKTMFATHYHEMTDFANKREKVINSSIQVEKTEDGIVFLHKIKTGSSNKSYGIEVAKLAGLPKAVTDEAQNILNDLEGVKQPSKKIKRNIEFDNEVNLFNYQSVNIINDLKSLPIYEMSPLEVTNYIATIQKELLSNE